MKARKGYTDWLKRPNDVIRYESFGVSSLTWSEKVNKGSSKGQKSRKPIFIVVNNHFNGVSILRPIARVWIWRPPLGRHLLGELALERYGASSQWDGEDDFKPSFGCLGYQKMNNDVILFRFVRFVWRHIIWVITNITFLELTQARWTFEAKTRVGFWLAEQSECSEFESKNAWALKINKLLNNRPWLDYCVED